MALPTDEEIIKEALSRAAQGESVSEQYNHHRLVLQDLGGFHIVSHTDWMDKTIARHTKYVRVLKTLKILNP